MAQAHSRGEHVLGAFFELMLQAEARTTECEKRVQSCLRDLTAIVQETFGTEVDNTDEWQVLPFGSAVSGFGTKTSDLDIAVCRAPYIDDGTRPAEILKSIRQSCYLSKIFKVHYGIWKGRIPLLKCWYDSVLQVDMSALNVAAVHNSSLLRSYAEISPDVARFGIAVKLWAKKQNLCGAPDKHLSSYSFVLMAIFFLQAKFNLPCLPTSRIETPNRRARPWVAEQSLGSLICRFFEFYANEFRWGEEVVSVRLGRRELSTATGFQELNGFFNCRLHIEDPLELTRNLNDILSEWNERKLKLAFKKMSDEILAGRHYAVLPQSAAAAAQPITVGCKYVAHTWSVVEQPGYIAAKPGDVFNILYVGPNDNSEECMWVYCEDAAGGKGWLSKQALFSKESTASHNLRLPEPRTIRAAYQAKSPGELSFKVGENVTLEYNGESGGDDGWAFGSTVDGRRGWFRAWALKKIRVAKGGANDSDSSCLSA